MHLHNFSKLTNGLLVFGRYRLKMILGRGGMGVVWLARDIELEKDIALKFLSEALANDSSAVRDLKKETRRGMELAHPNIIRVYGFYSGDFGSAVAMEFVEGNTMSSLRDTRASAVFEVEEIEAWTRELCSALDYAHAEAEIVHRDLKPANLMIDHRNRLKVADFGIASSLADAHTRLTGEIGPRGTMSFMSPQQLLGQRACVSHDIYSLGATLYDLLTGRPPFYSGDISLQIREARAPSIFERRLELEAATSEPIPGVWEETIAACLEKDATLRPRSAAEVSERLGLGQASGTVTAPSVTPITLATSARAEPTVYERTPIAQSRISNPATTANLEPPRRSLASAIATTALVLGSVAVGGAGAYFAVRHALDDAGESAAEGSRESPASAAPLPAPIQDYSLPPSAPGVDNSDVASLSGPGADLPPARPDGALGPNASRMGPPGTRYDPRVGRPSGAPGVVGGGFAGVSAANRVSGEMLDHPREAHDFKLAGTGLVFSWIPPGRFVLGAPSFEKRAEDNERDQTYVAFTHGFWMSRYEVTQGEYERVMGNNPSHFSGNAQAPVENVTWYEAMTFCRRLTEEYQSQLPDGFIFTLPTQAQFEYASGSGRPSLHGSFNNVAEGAWCAQHRVEQPQSVGTLQANSWELYDMAGNVAEWTRDWYADRLPGGNADNWVGPESGQLKVVKGGHITNSSWELRIYGRHGLDPGERKPLVGFRVALVPESGVKETP